MDLAPPSPADLLSDEGPYAGGSEKSPHEHGPQFSVQRVHKFSKSPTPQ